MKNCCLALLALMPLTAAAYPTELEKQLNGAEVSASIQDIDRNIGGLTLYNYGLTDAKCNAQFRNGPEAPRIRKASTPVSSSNESNRMSPPSWATAGRMRLSSRALISVTTSLSS